MIRNLVAKVRSVARLHKTGVHFAKTIYYNLKILPLKHALKFPILVYRQTIIKGRCGNFVIEDDLTFGMIKIGIHLSELVDRNEKTIVSNCGTIKFKGGAIIGSGSKLLVSKNSHFEIGHNFNVTGKMQVCCEHNIMIQDDCMFSWNVTMIDTDYHPIYDSKGHITNSPRPITIGCHVWVGCDCLILKGVNIADNCVISAGSTVRGNLESPNCIYGVKGLAVEKLKDGITWEKEVF